MVRKTISLIRSGRGLEKHLAVLSKRREAAEREWSSKIENWEARYYSDELSDMDRSNMDFLGMNPRNELQRELDGIEIQRTLLLLDHARLYGITKAEIRPTAQAKDNWQSTRYYLPGEHDCLTADAQAWLASALRDREFEKRRQLRDAVTQWLAVVFAVSGLLLGIYNAFFDSRITKLRDRVDQLERAAQSSATKK
jgi:hypothetical protein